MSECECANYKIIRFRRDKNYNLVSRRVIKRGLTRTEAQEHCQREDTHGEMWFDGFDQE